MTSLWGPGCASFDIDLPGVTAGNLNSAIYFAAAMLGLMAIFVAQHWIRRRRPSRSMPLRVAAAPYRQFRRAALRKVLGFKSAGHAMVVTIYIIVNLILLFTMLEWPLNLLSDFARRLGWVAVANIALLFFLALKNTPLAFLTGYSYQLLNDLHVIAGYTTILLSLLHSILFVVARNQQNELCNIIDIPQHPGMVALGAMGVILISAIVKIFRYEVFYVLHVIGAVLVLFGVGLHRPNFSNYSVRAIIFTAGIFVLDVFARWIFLLHNGRSQFAKLEPLDGGGVMITLTKPLPWARPGKFALLMIGSVKKLQSHPFTIVSVDPVTFIADSHAGFTRNLYETALREPGILLKATLHGPYGAVPKWESFSKIVLIAGGTGASFTFAVALDLLRKLDPNSRVVVEFVWALRDPARITWYSQALKTVRDSQRFNVAIYVTAAKHAVSPASTDVELQREWKEEAVKNSPDVVAMAPTFLTTRPNIHSIITSAVKSVSPDEKVVVAACGPASMSADVRNATAAAVSIGGPSVDLHIESFSY